MCLCFKWFIYITFIESMFFLYQNIITKILSTRLKYNWNGKCLTDVFIYIILNIKAIFFLETIIQLFFISIQFNKLLAITNELASLTSCYYPYLLRYLKCHAPPFFSPFSCKRNCMLNMFISKYKILIYS